MKRGTKRNPLKVPVDALFDIENAHTMKQIEDMLWKMDCRGADDYRRRGILLKYVQAFRSKLKERIQITFPEIPEIKVNVIK